MEFWKAKNFKGQIFKRAILGLRSRRVLIYRIGIGKGDRDSIGYRWDL